jgi:hypothetical protein
MTAEYKEKPLMEESLDKNNIIASSISLQYSDLSLLYLQYGRRERINPIRLDTGLDDNLGWVFWVVVLLTVSSTMAINFHHLYKSTVSNLFCCLVLS